MTFRPRVSSLVKNQLPRFIRENKPELVAFIEAYYKFVEENDIDLESIQDVDTTLDEFIPHLKAKIASNLPLNINEDIRKILPRIRDLYRAKGSVNSYKTFFQILYGKTAEIEYPADQILRPSDGEWKQDVSLFVRIIEGSPDDIIGRIVSILTEEKIISVQINKRQNVEVTVDNIKRIAENIYELTIDRDFTGRITYGNKIRYRNDDANIYFLGEILPTTSTISIKKAGTGFRVGQIYDINSFSGTGTRIKISTTDSAGGISRAELVAFGINYSTSFTSSLFPDNSTEINYNDIITISGNDISYSEYTDGLLDKGIIITPNYFELGYCDGSYAGDTLTQFSDSESYGTSSDGAVIEFNLGAIARYPGYFSSNRGFLDDSMYIQDGTFYQAFSYLVKIDEQLDSYKDALKALIHPAGFGLFSQYIIYNNYSITKTLESIIKVLSVSVVDTVEIDEELKFDRLSEWDENPDTLINYVGIHKVLNDTSIIEEAIKFIYRASFSDEVTIEDIGAILSVSLQVDESNISLEDNLNYNFTKSLSDSSVISELEYSHYANNKKRYGIKELNVGTSLSDEQEIKDNQELGVGSMLLDSIDGENDEGIIVSNPYVNPSYLNSDINNLYVADDYENF